MVIQLDSYKIDNLKFDSLSEKRKKNNFSMKLGHYFPIDDNQSFFVFFKIILQDSEFDLKLDIDFRFETDKKISNEFKESDFPKINAPAIAFPYIRAFISNLALQSGYNPAILPSINFANKASKEKAKKKS